MKQLDSQKVAILGAGRSGRAAAELCLKLGAKVAVYDANGISGEWPEGVELHENMAPLSNAEERFDLVVLSPGIETEGEFAQSFAKQSDDFIGELELGYQNYDGLVVAITGTNGKTTTTELISAFLNEGGISCVPCGNHGKPLSEVVLEAEIPEAIALEVSSFQLESIKTFKPDIAVWLNFAPDHMDRYENLVDYRAAKERIFENLDGEQVVVAKTGEEFETIKAKVVRFMSELDEDEIGGFTIRNDQIYYNNEPFVCLEETTLRGLHNAENVMAAAGAAQAAGVGFDKMKEVLKTFTAPPHRCELVRTLDQVEYLNDSKATNLHALESALRALAKPIVLIAGGKEKGLDYRPLRELVGERVKAVVTFGEIGEELAEIFEEATTCHCVDDLATAVPLAQTHAVSGDIVLFSPGTSSFDQFSSYIARGEAFREAVNQLK